MTLDGILYTVMWLFILAATITLAEKLYGIIMLAIKKIKHKKTGDEIHQFDITKDV